MKRGIRSIVLAMVLFFVTAQPALAVRLLVPGGQLVGLELSNDIVTVAAFEDSCPAAREAGLQIGDQILRVDGQAVSSAEDVRRALKNSGAEVALNILRGSKELSLTVSPAVTGGEKRLGVYLRQGIAGVGTVTYYDPEDGSFGTLGHGVSDNRGGLLILKSGQACAATAASVKKGRAGDPGQIRGSARAEDIFGKVTKNTPQGVFGSCAIQLKGEPLPIAAYEDVKIGPATIRSTVSGSTLGEYSVEILKVYPQSRTDCRNFLIRVTDPALLKATGGIIQGMSGSPIIQDGKLVGAVTHVLVNDPTRGYGIFIENMLDAAG